MPDFGSIPERNAQFAGSGHRVAIHLHGLGASGNLGQGHQVDGFPAERDHDTGLSVRQRAHGGGPETRSADAIKSRGTAAAQQVAEHDAAAFLAGQGCQFGLDQRVMVAVPLAPVDGGNDAGDVVGDLGNQDRVGAADHDQRVQPALAAQAYHLLARTCTKVSSILFLPRTVLATVFVPDRRYFPASRRRLADGSAQRRRWTRHR